MELALGARMLIVASLAQTKPPAENWVISDPYTSNIDRAD